MTPDAACVLVDGPWEHRFVAANGARFHVATLGEGPLVLMLHGFPQFWWAWRHQMAAVADAGYRAVALDLRGYGASDKPPRGYDTPTSCDDVCAVIRSLGEEEAVLVGHGWGAWIGWSMAALRPGTTRALAAVSMAHPSDFRRAWASSPAQARANRWIVGLQRPFVPERTIARDSGYVSRLLREWASPEGIWPSVEEASRYAEAAALPFVAHSSAEYFRWLGRSQLRPDGWRFARSVARPVGVPVLQLQGQDDRAVLPQTARAGRSRCAASYTYAELPGAGHFLPEEAPAAVSEHLLEWLDAAAFAPR